MNRGATERKSGFSLIEILASLAILSIIMVTLFTALSAVQKTWIRSQDRIEKYREVRVALDNMERKLSAATLNTYWGYNDPDHPDEYAPQSELHFVSGPMQQLTGDQTVSGHGIFFQAPLGYGGAEAGELGGGNSYNQLHDALNCWGYYIEFGSDVNPARPLRPAFLLNVRTPPPEKLRFRLMEFRLPTEKLELFRDNYANGSPLNKSNSKAAIHRWFSDESLRTKYSIPIAENIIALVVTPRAPGTTSEEGTEIAPDFYFDSRQYQWEDSPLSQKTRHQVPPVVDISLIAVTESSWSNFLDQNNQSQIKALQNFLASKLRTTIQLPADLGEIEAKLETQDLDYRIFSTTIAMRTGKWITSKSR